jgi:iron complex outermembrane recepter protein
VTLAFNWTETSLKEITALANETRKIQLEDQLPGFRAILSGYHSIGPWSFMARTSYFDSYIVALDIGADASGNFDGEYGGELLVDMEVGYEIADGYKLTVGAQNVFDNVPDQFPSPETNSGAIYPTGSPMGFNGGFWYARLNIDF